MTESRASYPVPPAVARGTHVVQLRFEADGSVTFAAETRDAAELQGRLRQLVHCLIEHPAALARVAGVADA